jgi:hypothetical protein
MVNIVCVKYGTKYNASHVNRLYEMVRENISLPFLFYCLTDESDGLDDNILPLEIDISLELESYWYKFCIFDQNLYGNDNPTLYLDLDTVIQNNIDTLFEIQDKPLRIAYIGEIATGDSYRWPTAVNSSIMLFIPSKVDHIRKGFLSNSDYNIIQYEGVCRYLWQTHKEDLAFFIPMKDFYSFIRVSQAVKDMGDVHKKYKVEHKFIFKDEYGRKGSCSGYHIPDLPICMLNGCSEIGILDQVYEYFSNYRK